MRKHLLRYLLFLAPAFLATLAGRCFPDAGAGLAAARWFFAFLMLLGYGLCTAAFAYRMPRAAAAFILYYTGINLLIITLLYSAQYGTAAYEVLRDYGGALSYVPLEILVEALLDFNVRQEVFVTLLIAASCTIGCLAGLLRRRVSPDPYRPTIG